jgi:hypothetical protein
VARCSDLGAGRPDVTGDRREILGLVADVSEVLPENGSPEPAAPDDRGHQATWRPSAYGPWLEVAAVAIGAAVLLALRAPFALHHLWAEDGEIFLQQAVTKGIARPFGYAYAGYYLFVPRVIGGVTAILPLRLAPVTTFVGVAVVVSWCAATIFVESQGWLSSRISRYLLAFSIVLLPTLGFEAIASSSTLQFTMVFAALVALMSTSTGRASIVNRTVLLALTGLTTPIALVLAPIAVVRVALSRPRRLDQPTIALAVATALQLLMIVLGRPTRTKGVPMTASQIAHLYLRSALYPNLLPKRLATGHAPSFLVFVIGCLVVAGVVLAWRNSQRDRALFLALVPATGLAFWVYAGARSAVVSGYLPARYTVFPAWCVLWAVLVAGEEVSRTLWPGRPVSRAMSVVAVLVLFSWAGYWTPAAFRSSGTDWSTAISNAKYVCQTTRSHTAEVAISPNMHTFHRWVVSIPCRDL